MIHTSNRIIAVLSIILLSRMFAHAQQAGSTKNYPVYLNNLATELAPAHEGAAIAFDKLAMTAVALAKTQGWTKASGAQARGLMEKDAAASARLLALHALLAGDVKPVLAVFGDRKTEPSYPEVKKAIGVLREHGYPAAADVLGTLARELNERRIIAWASLPANYRATVV